MVLTANAQKQAKQLEALGYGNCPICVAKTQYSLTDDQTKLGAPTDFEVTVRNLKISAGAGFIVALTGEIMTMPGLPKVPAAERDRRGRERKDQLACSDIAGRQAPHTRRIICRCEWSMISGGPIEGPPEYAKASFAVQAYGEASIGK